MPEIVDSFFSVLRESAREQEEQRALQVTLSTDAPAYIIPIGDIHLGHVRANLAMLQKVTQCILESKNCYTVLLGDLGETATKTSIGTGMFDETLHIPQQMSALKEIFLPLAKENKILGAVMGNHEYRMQQMVGMNPVGVLCEFLNVPYFDFQGFAELTVGEQKYEMVWHHGVGNGCTEGGKINASMRQTQIVEADLFVSGHTHARSAVETPIAYFDNGRIKQKTRHVVTVGSFLEYFGNYPQMKLLPIASVGPVMIELRHDSKEIHVYK